MRRCRLSASIALLAAAVLAFGGCGKESAPSTPLPTEENPNLEDDLGGLTATNESPAFGDPTLAASATSETTVSDEIASDPEMVRWANSDSARTFAVSVLWGMLASDPANTSRDGEPGNVPVTDWSGHIEVNRGGILLRSTVAFEPEDHVIRPRIDRKRIGWVSHTTGSFDGLRLLVRQPLPEGETGEQDSLTIVAGPHTWSFRVNDLVDLDLTEDADDLGNKFAIRSFLILPGPCLRGFLGGAWAAPVHPDSMGTFQGRWVSRDGELTGFVRGHFGKNDRGDEVLFGKYVDAEGAFRGFLRGTWHEAGQENAPPNRARRRAFGTFRAEILDEGLLRIGSVHGRWRSQPGGGDGFFEGTWSKGCPQP